MGLRDLAKRALHRAVSGGAAPSSPPPPRPAPVVTPPAAAAPPSPPASTADPEDRADKPWFMQSDDDLEGWDETNPGAEPGKKNLRP